MNFHDIFDALNNKATLKGYLGSLLTVFFGVIDLGAVQNAIAIVGGFLAMCLTMVSIYIKAQELIKNNLEIKELKNDDKD